MIPSVVEPATIAMRTGAFPAGHTCTYPDLAGGEF
jgi:hypothetical protein